MKFYKKLQTFFFNHHPKQHDSFELNFNFRDENGNQKGQTSVDSRSRTSNRENYLKAIYNRIGETQYPCIERPSKPKLPCKTRLTGAELEEYEASYPARCAHHEEALKIYEELLELNVDKFFEEVAKMIEESLELNVDNFIEKVAKIFESRRVSFY